MFKKTLVAAVAVLTVAGSTVATTSSAQAGPLGRAVAAGAIGFAIGAAAAGSYAYARPVYYGGCGWVSRPVYDAWGYFVGYRRYPAC